MWAFPATGEDESYTVSVCVDICIRLPDKARGRYRMTEISAPYLYFYLAEKKLYLTKEIETAYISSDDCWEKVLKLTIIFDRKVHN
jgi:hypothetical protein